MISSYEFIENINCDTTVLDFENDMKKNPSYGFSDISPNGFIALGNAAVQGNIEVVKYILSKAIDSSKLVNQQFSDYGWTPLFCAAMCNSHQKALNIAIELIKLGAKVNTQTTKDCDDEYPAGITPVWAAAKNDNRLMVSLLFNRRASEMITVQHSDEQRKSITEGRHISDLLSFWTCSKAPLPKDVLKIILTFMLNC
ncbi:MAG: ankyrin repeat domain-containing protein [Parachlamydiaceae bacterium]|nr:ankyrin repeat domain-containing protein [Parachlamydiaceae bacterium]